MIEELDDVGAPQRIAHFLHSYLMGISDRHYGNGMGRVLVDADGNKHLHIVPIDQGWAGRVPEVDFLVYAGRSVYIDTRGIGMDPNMFEQIDRHIDSITDPVEKERQKKAIRDAVDDMIERSTKLASMSNAEWVEYVKDFYPDIENDRALQKYVKSLSEMYKAKAEHLRTNRSILLRYVGAL